MGAPHGPVFYVVTEFISFVTLIAASLAFQTLHLETDALAHAPAQS